MYAEQSVRKCGYIPYIPYKPTIFTVFFGGLKIPIPSLTPFPPPAVASLRAALDQVHLALTASLVGQEKKNNNTALEVQPALDFPGTLDLVSEWVITLNPNTPPKTNMSTKMGNTSSNHWFSGDMLVF